MDIKKTFTPTPMHRSWGFTEASVLFPILTLYSVVYLGLMIYPHTKLQESQCFTCIYPHTQYHGRKTVDVWVNNSRSEKQEIPHP